MALPVIMHINYCEQGQSMEDVCYKAAAWGFDGVEFRGKRAGVEENSEQYLDMLEKAVRRAGLKHVIFGYDTTQAFTDEDCNREAMLEEVSDFYKLASERFKLSVNNAFSGVLLNKDKSVSYCDYDKNGSGTATPQQWKWAADSYKVLGKLAENLGFRFAFETHMCYLHDLPASARKLADMIDNPAVGINLDYGNTVYFKGEIPSVEEAVRITGNKLFYVHLKNSVGCGGGAGGPGRIPVGLGDGEINNRIFLRKLKESGYAGPLCIEGPRPGDREWYAQQDIIYLKALIRDIGL